MFLIKTTQKLFIGFKRKPERGDSSSDNVKARPSDGSESGKKTKLSSWLLNDTKRSFDWNRPRSSALPGSSDTDGRLFISDEDKNGKGAATDSVQQRRQYRRQNQESSSGAKNSPSLPNLPPSRIQAHHKHHLF